MESVPLRNITNIVKNYDGALLANDPRFNREVVLHHQDGSREHYTSAFLMKVPCENNTEDSFYWWIICFTEHHGVRINHSDDLDYYIQYSTRSPLDVEELKP